MQTHTNINLEMIIGKKNGRKGELDEVKYRNAVAHSNKIFQKQ